MIDSTSPGKDTPTESQNPKVSVVIPCYNRERYLGMAIQSVLAQTYTNFELIIVDNNSTDGSLQIAQIAAQQDSRIRILTEGTQGAAYALRTGFAAARGEYVGQVDSDDILEQLALEFTAAVLDDDKACGMVYTNYIDIDVNGRKLRPGKRCSIPYSKERLLVDFMTFHFRLIRQTKYHQVGGIKPEFNQIEDFDLCLRLSESTIVKKINDYLYLYRIHPDSIRVTMDDLERTMLCKKAISQALIRRGMADTHEVTFSLNPTFFIKELKLMV